MSGCRQIFSGELHYARIPRASWRRRLDMAYAMGLDTVSTYVFWNVHEPRPGEYDFDGERDVAEFVRTAAASGLDVILRPGPYVCAEWDFGGLPAWLLADAPVAIRTRDEAFMAPVRRWLARLGRELAPLQRVHGGPIVAVQLENEYGAFGNDGGYLAALRGAYDAAGFAPSPYFTIDQAGDVAAGAVDDLPAAITFAPGDPQREFGTFGAFRANAPLLCGEYWAGWFDHWGEPHEARDLAQQVRDVEWMIAAGTSFNFYMFHGGTNFGFSNGANVDANGRYLPDVTSYDYLAALDEAGRPTEKFAAFRAAIAAATGKQLRPVPPAPRTIDIPAFRLDRCASLEPLCAHAIRSERPIAMEALGQAFGFVRYRTQVDASRGGELNVDPVRDFATVLVDGVPAGHLDRRTGETSLSIAPAAAAATLDVLIENCGRVNYGPAIVSERKGLVGAVRWNGRELLGWEIAPLPLDDLSNLQFTHEFRLSPAFFRGQFELSEPHDTFLDCSGLGKGVLFVNGHNAGRFWKIGPQRSLYVPAVWLKAGTNEVVVFDVMPSSELFIRGCSEPIM